MILPNTVRNVGCDTSFFLSKSGTCNNDSLYIIIAIILVITTIMITMITKIVIDINLLIHLIDFC